MQHANRIEYCHLQSRRLIEADLYPRFTLLGQAVGSFILGLEALFRMPPPLIWWDSMGYAFTYPAARFLAGCRVACYVHFPMISSDMLDAVAERRPSYNNDARVADSVTASQLKLAYYRAFALAYRLVGKCAEVVMCNSTWTKNHISALWGTPALLVYPPCLEKASPSISMQRQPLIVSIGQYKIVAGVRLCSR